MVSEQLTVVDEKKNGTAAAGTKTHKMTKEERERNRRDAFGSFSLFSFDVEPEAVEAHAVAVDTRDAPKPDSDAIHPVAEPEVHERKGASDSPTAKRTEKKVTKGTAAKAKRKPAKKPVKKQVTVDWNPHEELYTDVIDLLLIDRTTGANITWAVDAYEKSHGAGFGFSDEMKLEQVTGENADMVKPRIAKSAAARAGRTKDKAEVFTPSWVCNLQNNIIDESWFGRSSVFNTMSEDNTEWKPTSGKIDFSTVPDGKTWEDYIDSNRMEITCGEAPYLVSRYDTVTGIDIPVESRIGLLDRKLRVVGENCDTHDEERLYSLIKRAYRSIYGFEWQGDNLLLARKNLFATFLDYWGMWTGHEPTVEQKREIAEIISWNIFQMDGIEMTRPGCDTKVLIMDWGEGRPIEFSSLAKQ